MNYKWMRQTALAIAVIITVTACGTNAKQTDMTAANDAAITDTQEDALDAEAEEPENTTAPTKNADAEVTAETAVTSLKTDNYTLKKLVVLSRHNIRSPMSGSGSVLAEGTPHEWFDWTSDPSELSQRGGVLETEMGQYFRKWLAKEGIFEEDSMPGDEVRFYANAKQRTIATANYFASAMFPAANIDIETHAEYNTMDDVFNPQLTFVTETYREAAEKEMKAIESQAKLADSYAILEKVIDLHESDAYKDGTVADLKDGDTKLILEENSEPGMEGSLKTATQFADALVLQYYEEADAKKAAFGENLTKEDWEAIAGIKDVYQNVLFTAPLIAANVAHPLLMEIDKELENADRKFTFLCGHDSNLGSVLAALGAKPYTLPGAVEQTVPIGAKLVFEVWEDNDGQEYVGVEMFYQNVSDLKNTEMLSINNPPNIVTMSFDGMDANADGLYAAKDFYSLMHNEIEAYDRIKGNE